MGRFIQKQKQTITPSLIFTPKKQIVEVKTSRDKENNKKTKQKNVMTTAEKINAAQDILSAPQVKKIKKEKGLLERTEGSCTIITEDNKELLMD